jgi:NADH:ubiquinone oxidoreductase subunit F (NADH-binding)
MPPVVRILDPEPVASLAAYLASGGGRGIAAARELGPAATIDEVTAAGIRGRGGAGFPTGVKWRTVAANASTIEATSVVINAAEGEPGSFKDRALLDRNPYRVLEGALIAAFAVGANDVIVGMKRTATRQLERVRAAIAELEGSDLAGGVSIDVVAGPPEYLLGEETALLEVIDGRDPFPRIAPPYRRGVDEVVETASELTSESGLSARVEMAGANSDTGAPPTLVDNVETLAHVAVTLAEGADWFREVGTPDSPGTVVCTVSGAVQHAGVGEFAMGTPLREIIETLGGGARPGRTIRAVLQGAAAAIITADRLDTPASWEGMQAIGSGLGAGAFMVLDDATDISAVAASVSRFLAVESCGQCTPCKQDGLLMSDALAHVAASHGTEEDVDVVRKRINTVADGARCSLATQHQVVIGSFVAAFGADLEARVTHTARAGADLAVVPMVDVRDGVAVLDADFARKQPDWTYGSHWSGQSPADRRDDHRAHPDPL